MAQVLQLPPTHTLHKKPSFGAIKTSAQAQADAKKEPEIPRFERKLGDSELSYFLPSRASGVNDMYLHLGFRAPQRLLKRRRVCLVWAILRNRHPLLAAQVEMRDYEDVRFVYTPPPTPYDSLLDADANLEYGSMTKDALIGSYLNGPRILSNQKVSHLIVSRSNKAVVEEKSEYDLLICASHFLGDGMALHNFANDFFSLVGGGKSNEELREVLIAEFEERRQNVLNKRMSILPSPLEDRLPQAKGFRRVVGKVDFKENTRQQIGGHAFPRRSASTRHTIVPTVSFDKERTKAILKKCKANGVSISAALFAICNIAWARECQDKKELPVMMYSALNLRPHLSGSLLHDSYWFLAVGYFNVILPSFIWKTGDVSKAFWHRARSAKEQSTRAAKNPLLVTRSREMAQERGTRARAWAKEDDEKASGIWKQLPPKPHGTPTRAAPSTALIGLSLLGNLDGIYKHASFSEIEMHTLTTGSRQRESGMLLFGYTFAGKLWVSLGYDENGFAPGVVQNFWNGALRCIDELL